MQYTATKLGTEPIGKLLMQYAIPAIIAMTATSLYNMVDSIFIGQGVGPLAISGLAITFPFMNLTAAFGAMIGVGASTLISVKLGEKDYDTAQQVFGNVVTLKLITGVLISIIAILLLDPTLRFFGASDDTLPYAHEYMLIILSGNVISHTYFGFNAILRASGHPRRSMAATIMAVLINTVLDALFIFVFKWGIQGAAIATIIAQAVTLAWQISIFANPDELLHFKRGIYRMKRNIVNRIFAIGMSPFLMNMASCLVVIFINKGLQTYDGDMAIGAFGIVNRITFIYLMVVFGFNQGMQPIAGYNFGAQQWLRVNQVLKITILCATVVMTTGFILGELFPAQLARLFTNDAQLIAQSVTGSRIVCMFFPIIGFQIVTTNFFQSIGLAQKAIFLSLTRQLIFLLPCAIVLPMFIGVKGVWFSMPIADLVASIITAWMLYRQFQIFKQKALLQ